MSDEQETLENIPQSVGQWQHDRRQIKAFVLLSGGMDSTTTLYRAMEAHGPDHVAAIIINYNQRHKVELAKATLTIAKLGISGFYSTLGDVFPLSVLTDPSQAVPKMSYADIKGVSPVFVPFRNGVFLSAASALICGVKNRDLQESLLYFGAHAEDAAGWAYPDCTPEFTGAMANAIRTGTYDRVRLVVPFQYSTKTDIVREGTRLGVNWKDTWSCYEGGTLHCGICPTCIARKLAFIRAGVSDPTYYSEL